MIKKLSKSLLDAKDEEIHKLREEVALLAAQLVANGITPNRAPRHNELPVALRSFVPLTDAAGIKEVAPKLNWADEVINEAAETGLSVSASSSSLAEAAAQASSEGLEHIAPAVTEGIAAYKAAIEERVAQSDCVSSCTEALNAGNTRFEKVYESVWTYVSECEEAWHDFPTAMATLTAATKAPAGTLKQEGVSNVVDLYRKAVHAKKPFEESCAEMTKLIEALQVDAQLKLAPSLKHIGRTIEKVSFDDDPHSAAAHVKDVNRGMIFCESMRDVNGALEALAEGASAGSYTIVRVKDRFTTKSPGGWRDVLVNLAVAADGHAHICELQVVHKSLVVARVGLNGHGVYDRVRNCAELLEKLGMLGNKVNDAGQGWTFNMGEGAASKPLAKKPVLSSSRPSQRNVRKKGGTRS